MEAKPGAVLDQAVGDLDQVVEAGSRTFQKPRCSHRRRWPSSPPARHRSFAATWPSAWRAGEVAPLPPPRARRHGRGTGCDETLALLEEVAALSQRLELSVHDLDRERPWAAELGVTRVPTTVLSGAARGRVRWLGLPTGHELGLCWATWWTCRAQHQPGPAARHSLAGLRSELRLAVFVTPACPALPRGGAPRAPAGGGEPQRQRPT